MKAYTVCKTIKRIETVNSQVEENEKIYTFFLLYENSRRVNNNLRKEQGGLSVHTKKFFSRVYTIINIL